jgi:exodeoxyribonuclease VII small subunit
MAKPSTPSAAPAVPDATTPVAAFERSLAELETIVARLEGGELGLDESLAAFERGIALFRECQGALDAAEQRVRLLADPAQPDAATPFAPASD